MIWRRNFVLLTAMAAVSALSHASVISIESSITTRVENDALHVSVKIKNNGDEAARSVVIHIESPQSQTASPMLPTLAIKESHTVAAKHSLAGLTTGRYPVTVLTQYTDANGYPLSALTVTTIDRGSPKPVTLLARLEARSIDKRGKVKLTIKNSGETDVPVTVRLVVPPELTADPVTGTHTIPARGTKNMTLPIENFSALTGSHYWIYAIIESDHGGNHATVLAPVLQSVTARAFFSRDTLTYLMVGVMLLYLLIRGRVAWEKRKKDQASRDTQKSSKAK